MWHDLFIISPLIITTVIGLVALLASAFGKPGTSRQWLGYVMTFGFGVAILAGLWLYGQDSSALAFQHPSFQYSLVADHFGLGLSLVIMLGAALVCLSAVDYLPAQRSDHGEFYALIAFASLGMMAMVMANDLLTLFVALELMSLAVYTLAGFKRSSKFSTESAIKYFVIGSFSAGLLLLGIAFTYGATGQLTLTEIDAAIRGGALERVPELVRFGMILIAASFLFKVAAAPFHMWAPDVYQGAPAAVTSFMAIAVKTSAFGAFARVMLTAFGTAELRTEGFSWEIILIAAAILSMVTGNLKALAQKNLMRLLAYSAIVHTGYMMLAILMVTDSDSGVAPLGAGFVFYLLGYTLANAAAFGVVAAVSGDDREDIGEEAYQGLAKRSPGMALALAVSMLSLLGIPLTIGFMGKLTVFEEFLTARPEMIWLAVVAILNSVISAWYYLRVMLVAYMRDEDENEPIRLIKSRALGLSVGIATALTLAIGLFPSKSLSMTEKAGESLATYPDTPEQTADSATLKVE